MPSPLLFSDVDGTLLGSDGRYVMTATELRRILAHIDIVLASSRTVLELSRNQHDLGIDGPVVAENGAVVAFPWSEEMPNAGTIEEIDSRSWHVVLLGAPARCVRAEVRAAALLCGVTYVDQEDVEPSLGRRCSVLLRRACADDGASFDALVMALRARGLTVASNEAWLAVTGGADKGGGARVVLEWLEQRGRYPSWVAAVGDGDNDGPLLMAAERRFVIRRENGSWHPALRALPGVECVPIPGIDGWRDVVHQLSAQQERR